jgi:hypothetical protein
LEGAIQLNVPVAVNAAWPGTAIPIAAIVGATVTPPLKTIPPLINILIFNSCRYVGTQCQLAYK